jgi:hypothetical protein
MTAPKRCQPPCYNAGMSDHRQDSASEFVANASGLCAAGIICPAEMWNQIEEGLRGQDFAAVAESCPRGIQLLVQHIYRDRTWPQSPDESAFKAAIRGWCSR